jgi:peroxiredoxin Q/BCP
MVSLVYRINSSNTKGMLKPGDPLPSFSLPDHTGRIVTDQSLRQQWSVIYFYPKDQTPGCTVEACSFRDAHDQLTNLGVAVYGISGDQPETHRNFRDIYSLPFTLLSDPSHQTARSFGTWVEIKRFGKLGFRQARATFIISPDSRVAKVFPHVTPAGHAAEVAAAVRELQVNAHA